MPGEGGKISPRKDGKKKVTVNKRLLIGAAFVVSLGNIKVSPFPARSDRCSLSVWPLFTFAFVAPKTALKGGVKKARGCFGFAAFVKPTVCSY